METLNDVLKFNIKERAFRNGWNEIYELADQFFDDVDQKHIELLKRVKADMKNDLACISDPDWKSRLDKSCNLVSQLAGISKLKMFICTPIYDETDITVFTTEQEAHETGKRKAYNAMLNIWIISCNSCNKQILEDEQKLHMIGARNLLKRISEVTGFEFNHIWEDTNNENDCI